MIAFSDQGLPPTYADIGSPFQGWLKGVLEVDGSSER